MITSLFVISWLLLGFSLMVRCSIAFNPEITTDDIIPIAIGTLLWPLALASFFVVCLLTRQRKPPRVLWRRKP